MSEVGLSCAELDEELERIRQLRDQALAGDSNALTEFGRRFYALGPKLRACEQSSAPRSRPAIGANQVEDDNG